MKKGRLLRIYAERWLREFAFALLWWLYCRRHRAFARDTFGEYINRFMDDDEWSLV